MYLLAEEVPIPQDGRPLEGNMKDALKVCYHSAISGRPSVLQAEDGGNMITRAACRTCRISICGPFTSGPPPHQVQGSATLVDCVISSNLRFSATDPPNLWEKKILW